MMGPIDIERALPALEAELYWLQCVLELRLRALQREGILPPSGERFPGTTIGPAEVEARLRRGHTSVGGAPTPSEDAANRKLRAAIHARDALRASSPTRSPLDAIRHLFGLDDDEFVLILLSLAAQFDPSFPRLFGYLQNHFERQFATLSLVADCLTIGTSPARLRRLLAPDGPLRAFGLIRLGAGGEGHSIMQAPLFGDPRIVAFVEGRTGLTAPMLGCAALIPVPKRSRSLTDPTLDAVLSRLKHLITAVGEQYGELPLLIFRGAPGVGRGHLAIAAARQCSMGLLEVDCSALAAVFGTLEAGLHATLREARLQDALVCMTGWEQLSTPSGDEQPSAATLRGTLARTLRQALRDHPGIVILKMDEGASPPHGMDEETETFTLEPPDFALSVHYWKRLIPSARRGPGAEPEALARAFSLTPGQMVASVRRAMRENQRDAPLRPPPLSGARISAAVRQQFQAELGGVATLVESPHQWSDLIISAKMEAQLQELINRKVYHEKVIGDWGLSERFGSKLGISALFAGPSGTGKTMSAGLVAKKLGLDLYQIDLSQVVSKWLGETQKSLARIFDEAERNQVMLLFDEADSLFSKRTSVSSSNDRYANLEVNYLLQRMDAFTGIAILTTNFADSLDDAFKRRLTMRITFSKPDAAERARLWRSMLNSSDLPKGDIDDGRLGKDYEISGGLIRNAVLRAAFLAASSERPVDTEILALAARIEMREQGYLVHGSTHLDDADGS